MPRGPLYKYTPGQALAAELEATFVAREGFVDRLTIRTRQWLDGEAPEHTLIVGARGMGKTHVLRLLAHRLEYSPRLSLALFPEESYTIGTTADLLADACARLQLPGWESARDLHTGADALEKLRTLHEQDGRRFLLLIDGFDLLLDQLHEVDEAKIHQLLTTEDYICIIATAVRVPDALTNSRRPLFQLLRLEPLRPLESVEADTLLRKRAEWAGESELLERWAEFSPRIRAVADLAGGNPRLLLMLYQSLEVGELPGVVEAFRSLLDELTPFFKHVVEDRAPQQRKLLALAAMHNRGASPSELARESGLQERQVAALLGILERDGLLKRVRRPGSRTSAYPFTEPLLRMWLQMRASAEDERRVTCIVEFFRAWYADAEDEYARVFLAQLQHILDLYTTGRHDTMQEALASLRYLAEAAPSWESASAVLMTTMSTVDKMRDLAFESAEVWETVLASANQILSHQSDDLLGLFARGGALVRLGRLEAALADLTRVRDAQPEEPSILMIRGAALLEASRLEEALADLQQAVELKSLDAPLSKISEAPYFAQVAIAAAVRDDHSLAMKALEVLLQAVRGVTPEIRRGSLVSTLATIFRSGQLGLCQEALGRFGEAEVEPDLLEPFRLALAYITNGQDLYFLQALHPDIRRAVELIVADFGNVAPTNAAPTGAVSHTRDGSRPQM